MKVAYQTWLVLLLGVIAFALGQIQGDTANFPLNPLWRTVLIPSLLLLITGAANQLKAIGGPPPQ